MPTTYMKVESSDGRHQDVMSVMEQYHGDLAEAGVTVTMLLAQNEDGPAVMHNGYAALATIKITSLKDRAAGLGDCILIVDGNKCDDWPEKQTRAIYDHELTHLELVLRKDGGVKRDDLNRPKLRIRKHDFQYGWFATVAERHKDDSVEVQQLQAVGSHAVRQGWLAGF